MPDMPTVAESGVADYEVVSTLGLFAPAKTPSVIVQRLYKEVGAALNTAVVKQRMLKETGDAADTNTPGEFAAEIRENIAEMAKLIKHAGITIE